MINDNTEPLPLKTIVLFIFLHGEETLNIPLDVSISNTLINPSGKLGLCVYGNKFKKSNYTLDTFDYYKTLLEESKTINDFNYIMSTITENGRLGNQIIRNLAVSLIAEKFNLNVNYCNKSLIETLGIECLICIRIPIYIILLKKV